jgi:enamine deaminase RidA (YjgF/YER057c/UK114 family)
LNTVDDIWMGAVLASPGCTTRALRAIEGACVPRKELKNPNLPEPRGYARAVEARGNRIIVTSMTAPVDGDGNVVGPNDAELQARQVMKNLKDILEINGAGLHDVVRLCAYVVKQEDASTVMRVMGESLASPTAMALAVVGGLPNPAFAVEIEAMAVIG